MLELCREDASLTSALPVMLSFVLSLLSILRGLAARSR